MNHTSGLLTIKDNTRVKDGKCTRCGCIREIPFCHLCDYNDPAYLEYMKTCIHYSHNWNNKLDCSIHTTIRISNENKKEWYKSQVGNIFLEKLIGINYNIVRLIGVEEKRYCLVDDRVLMLDTGIDNRRTITETFKKFGLKEPNQPVLILTLKIISKL